MEQHPIPQQISSYQFKLVGDMTLKQFFQVAGGALVGLLFYSTSLHPIIKWPIILLSTGLGAAMAFLPFQERPLEKWIIAFFRSIYSATIFDWKKTEKIPVFFTEEAPHPEITNVSSLNQKQAVSPLEEAERAFLNKIGGLFKLTNQNTVQTPQQTVAINPQPTTISAPIVPAVNSETSPNKDQQPKNSAVPVISIPQQIPTLITKTTPKLIVEETSTTTSGQILTAQTIDVQKTEDRIINSASVEFSIDAAPPNPPSIPNTISGQVMNWERKIIEGAILEIRDSTGKPVRALKSNKAGHFLIVTPLINGKYEIIIEKEGFDFKPVSFEAKGEIIPPIAIRANKI